MMKRRHLLRYTGASLLATVGTAWAAKTSRSQTTGNVSIRWLGHTCFLFAGDKQKVLVNPFRTVGCTNGYRSPKVEANAVLISSQLFDEGAVEGLPGNPKIFYEPGVYKFEDLQFQGIQTNHDRKGGRQFGTNVAWRWTQGGLNILHLGGAAAPIEIEQKILMGRPDLLLVPVGGGPKAYKPDEAAKAIQALNPKMVIPTHYRTSAADTTCDLVSLDEFLKLMSGTPVRNIDSDTITIKPSDLSANGMVIQVLNYKFNS